MIESERKKVERLEERCEAQLEQVDRLKSLLEESDNIKREAVRDLAVSLTLLNMFTSS